MVQLHILNGPDMGRSFDLVGAVNRLGRSGDNNIQIMERSVSRKHLEIQQRGNKFFVKDLKSKNGTYINGNRIPPDTAYEVREGVPIVVGMSVICLGKGCLECVQPFLDSIALRHDRAEGSGILEEQRTMTTQKNMELVYKVSDVLTERLDIEEILDRITDYIFDVFKRIDRVVISLVDLETGDVNEPLSRCRDPRDDLPLHSRDVANRVIKDGKALVISDPYTENGGALGETLKMARIGSVMCVPLDGTFQIQGAIYVDSLRGPHGFRKDDLSLLMDLAKRAGRALENARIHTGLEKESSSSTA